MPREIIGETLLNQFRVESFIASGGMATIFRVWDLQRSVPLAMKVLRAELAEDPAFIARFKREAHSLQMLVHPHIVPFYGLFQAGELTFLLERYIDGPSLDEVLRRRNGRPLSIAESLVYFKGLYTSLGYAHAQGIIHCDVKPGNVLIDQGGHIYLTDFGIARYMDSSVTTSSALGTPLYMAPEQIRGDRMTPQADVYSLGVLMFELLTGQRPFRGDVDVPKGVGVNNADRIRYQHLNQAPLDPRAVNPDLPEGLAYVILRALSKDPAARYPSVQAMAHEISQTVAARFETLPDRVRLPDELRQGSGEWAPDKEAAAPVWPWRQPAGPPVPVERASEGGDTDNPASSAPVDWDQNAGTSPAGWEQARWNESSPPQATQPGYAPIPAANTGYEGVGRRSPNLMRMLLLLAGVALIMLCFFAGARLASGLAGIPARATQDLPLIIPPEDETPTAAPDPENTATQAAEETTTPTAEEPSPTPEPTDQPTPEDPAVGIQPLDDFPVPGEFAIVRRSDGVDRLFVLDAASGEQRLLPDVPGVNAALYHAPQWSPDGARLAWMSRYNQRMHIVAMDMEDMTPYQIAAGNAYAGVSSPTWAGDGQRVSFYASGDGGMWFVTADGDTGEELESIRLSTYRNLFVWNWQTGLLSFIQYFDGRYGVVVSSTAQAAERRIITGDEDYAPAWSNDGQWLAFQSDAERELGQNEIWIARADGSDLQRVTFSPEGTWQRAPTWSPDGRMIGYVSSRSGATSTDHGELFVVNLDTGQVRQMTNTGGLVYNWRPAWRP
jgi:serine/threonine protein kinase